MVFSKKPILQYDFSNVESDASTSNAIVKNTGLAGNSHDVELQNVVFPAATAAVAIKFTEYNSLSDKLALDVGKSANTGKFYQIKNKDSLAIDTSNGFTINFKIEYKTGVMYLIDLRTTHTDDGNLGFNFNIGSESGGISYFLKNDTTKFSDFEFKTDIIYNINIIGKKNTDGTKSLELYINGKKYTINNESNYHKILFNNFTRFFYDTIGTQKTSSPVKYQKASGKIFSFELYDYPKNQNYNDIFDLSYQLNTLNKEYEKLISKKEEILAKDERHAIVLRANQNIKDRTNFYRDYTKKLKIVTLITHIALAVIILVMIVYKLA